MGADAGAAGAPRHGRPAAVSRSLNSSAFYLGTALGAAAGALAIDVASVAAIGWTAALFEIAGLLLYTLTARSAVSVVAGRA
jgi:predicted MFS family arabinose efflux permease